MSNYGRITWRLSWGLDVLNALKYEICIWFRSCNKHCARNALAAKVPTRGRGHTPLSQIPLADLRAMLHCCRLSLPYCQYWGISHSRVTGFGILGKWLSKIFRQNFPSQTKSVKYEDFRLTIRPTSRRIGGRQQFPRKDEMSTWNAINLILTYKRSRCWRQQCQWRHHEKRWRNANVTVTYRHHWRQNIRIDVRWPQLMFSVRTSAFSVVSLHHCY